MRNAWLSLSTILMISACATQPGSGRPPALAGNDWQLRSIQSMDDAQGTTKIPDTQRYTVSFGPDGKATLRLDCNRGSGSWQATPAAADSGSLTFGPIAVTRMFCAPDSLDQRIIRDLAYVRSYRLKDGNLYMSLMADGGIYEWVPTQ
jgi:heat shock protein HslJ